MTDHWRERILSSVRDALGPLSRGHGGPLFGEAPAVSAPCASLIDCFTIGAREAGAEVTIARGHEETSRAVSAILTERRVASAVFSSASSALLPLPEWRGQPLVRSQPEREALFSADAGVTRASWGLADTGTLVLEASATEHRLDSLLPPIHVALLDVACLLPDLSALFPLLSTGHRFDASSAITFVRGPSRTADVELTLSIGVHGPRELHIVLCEQ